MKYTLNKYHQNKDRKTSPSDEYYTKYEEVKHIFENILLKEDLKDKIIYCPADGEESNFVIYLKEHKDDIKYKELIYTSDDMMTHEDIFQKADYIITNPPFSLLRYSMLPLLKRNNCKFFLFGSLINNMFYLETFSPNECKYMRRDNFSFITQFIGDLSGINEIYVASTIYLTNMNVNENYKEYAPNKKFLSKSIKDIPNVLCLDEDTPYLIIDKMHDFPNDYYEPVWATLSVFQYKYTKYFEYLHPKSRTNIHDKIWCDKCSDGKNRFLRFLVRLKKNI